MSKECPSCHRDCPEVWECVDCGRMFCMYCGGGVLFLEMLLPPRCPDCVGVFRGRGEKVSRDDSEVLSHSDYSASTDDSSYSSEDAFNPDYASSPGNSDYSSGRTSAGGSDGRTISAETFRNTMNTVIIGSGILFWLYELIDIWHHSSGFEGVGLFALINGIGGLLNLAIGGTITGVVIGAVTWIVFVVANLLLSSFNTE